MGCWGALPVPYYIRTWDTHQMFDELWSEIQDAPGEIFDLPELRDLDEEKFNVNDYLNSNIDYWNDSFNSELYWWRCNLSGFDWCYFYSHHSGECVPFLLQFSPA